MFQIFLDRLPEFAVFHQVVENPEDGGENNFFFRKTEPIVPESIKFSKTLKFEHFFCGILVRPYK